MFAECHAHIFMNGTDYRAAVAAHRNQPDEMLIRSHLEEYRKRNITFIRDGGDPYGVSSLAARLAPEYGITYCTPGFALHREGYYGNVVGFGYRTLKEYHDLVLNLKQQGGDFVKIMTTGIMDFETDGSITGEPLPRQEVRELIHIAHEEGMAVMVHVNGSDPVIWAAEAGADSIEHGNYLNEEAVCCMAERRTVYVPTVVTVSNLIGKGRFSDETLCRIHETQKLNLELAWKQGVLLARGSDAGAYAVLHGQGVLDENTVICSILKSRQNVEERLNQGDQEILRRFSRNSR